ncbi:hypothetical protein ABLA76_15825 [Xenorhabdus sp. SGI240]
MKQKRAELKSGNPAFTVLSFISHMINSINSLPVILCHPVIKTCISPIKVNQAVLSSIDEPILLMFTGGEASRLHVT